MRKLIYFILCAAFLVCATSVPTSAADETKKTRKERNAEYRKEFDTKASKTARKKAKEKKAAGWKPIGGGMPIEVQLERTWQYDLPNDDGEKEYIVESGTATGTNLASAQASAKQQARLAIAKTLGTEITALGEGSLNNLQLSDEESRDVNKMNEVYTSFVNEKLKKTFVVSEFYRQTENGKYQVEVNMALKIATLKEEAQEAWLNEVKSKNEELYNKLQDRLDQNKY